MNLKKLLLVLVVLAGVHEACARGGRGGGRWHGGGRGWHGRGGWGRGWGWGLGGAGLGLAIGSTMANRPYYYAEPSTTYVIDRSAQLSQNELAALREENRKLSEQINELRKSLHMPTEQVHPAVQNLIQQNAWLKEQIDRLQKQGASPSA